MDLVYFPYKLVLEIVIHSYINKVIICYTHFGLVSVDLKFVFTEGKGEDKGKPVMVESVEGSAGKGKGKAKVVRFEGSAGKMKEEDKAVGEEEGKGVKRVIVCCLPAIPRDEIQVAVEALEKSKKKAIARGKRVVEQKKKEGDMKRSRLVRNSGRGVPWSRQLRISEPSSPLRTVKEEEYESSEGTDSSCQILGEAMEEDDGAGPSVYMDLTGDDIRTEVMMSDADMMRANTQLFGLMDPIPPSALDAEHLL